MKLAVLVSFILAISILSCKPTGLLGTYACDASQKKKDTTIRHDGYDEVFIDLTCFIIELNFKGNSTVVMNVGRGQVVNSYVVDNGYVRIKGDKGDLLFKIIDKRTLKAEGFPTGTYYKK